MRQPAGLPWPSPRRSAALALVLALATGACGGGGGSSGPFSGAVVADDPLAVQVGRDVLLRGGSAADAAVATALMLSVTLPSMATIGGGGVCLLREAKGGRVEALEFYAGPTSNPPSARADRPSAVPFMLRGLFALHARGGRLPFGELILPAESFAREGFPLSRQLAEHMRVASRLVLGDGEARKLTTRADGQLMEPGEVMRNVELAALLSHVRLRGVGELYA
ncbi:MAG: gamma-glutamyltransferase, partial [Alphaproteobacteria bacterium]|nr:gamma-glutamyltransferase [Alphaproteobacteria bacterium]